MLSRSEANFPRPCQIDINLAGGVLDYELSSLYFPCTWADVSEISANNRYQSLEDSQYQYK